MVSAHLVGPGGFHNSIFAELSVIVVPWMDWASSHGLDLHVIARGAPPKQHYTSANELLYFDSLPNVYIVYVHTVLYMYVQQLLIL